MHIYIYMCIYIYIYICMYIMYTNKYINTLEDIIYEINEFDRIILARIKFSDVKRIELTTSMFT